MMTQLSRLNKTTLIDKLLQSEQNLKDAREQRTALVVVLAVITIINLLF
jgi:hypothetical protein